MNAGEIAGGSVWVALWAESLWRASWQGALFILAVWLACRLVPCLPAAARCWLWCLALLKLLVGLCWGAPLTVALLPAPRQEVSPASRPAASPPPVLPIARVETGEPAHPAVEAARAPKPATLPAVSSGEDARPAVPERPHQPWGPWLLPVLLAAWLAGVAWRLAGAARSWHALRRLVRAARPVDQALLLDPAARIAAELGLRSPPPLLASDAAPGPLVVGPIRPRVLLPAAACERLSPEELRMALAHEMAHVARGDLWLAFVPCLVQALFFFHPLVGLACREWVTAREAACDALALLVAHASPAAYGRLLLKLAASGRDGVLLPALGAMTPTHTLRRRLLMLQQFSPRSRRWAAGLIALVTLGVLGLIPWRVTAAEARRPAKSALQGVKELEKPVTYTETKIPLGELVEKVARDTGVTLTAAPEVADEPVAVVVKALPARELLDNLAELLDYRWSRHLSLKGWRYEIYQDLASKQREEALRQAALGDVERRFREEVAQYVAVAALPEKEIERLRAGGDRRLQQLRDLAPDQRRDFLRRPGGLDLGRHYGIARQLSSPVCRAMATLLGQLSPQQWARLRQGETLAFATDPQPGELPLATGLAHTFRGAGPDMASGMHYGLPEFEEQERQREKAEAEKWSTAPGYRVTLRMDIPRFRTAGSLTLNAQAQPVHPEASPRGFQGGQGTRLSIAAYPIRPAPPGAEVTAERDPQMVNDPLFGTKRRFKPDPKAPPNHLGVVPHFRTRMLKDLLPEVAQTYGAQIVADAYRTGQNVFPSLPSEPVALHALMDALVTSTHHWERHGSVVLVRSRTWFFDRPREIPLRLVRRWKDLTDRYGLLPLEECLTMATTLSEVQMAPEAMSATAFEADLSPDFSMLSRARGALHLYDALTPGQRQTLWRGQTLAVAQMTPRQRELLVASLEESRRNWPDSPSLAHVGGAMLSMWRDRKLRTMVSHGSSTRATYQPLPPPANGLDTEPTTGGSSRPTRTRRTEPNGVSRYPIMSVLFLLRNGPELWGPGSLWVAP